MLLRDGSLSTLLQNGRLCKSQKLDRVEGVLLAALSLQRHLKLGDDERYIIAKVGGMELRLFENGVSQW